MGCFYDYIIRIYSSEYRLNQFDKNFTGIYCDFGELIEKNNLYLEYHLYLERGNVDIELIELSKNNKNMKFIYCCNCECGGILLEYLIVWLKKPRKQKILDYIEL